MRAGSGVRSRVWGVALGSLLAVLLALPAMASAAGPELLYKTPFDGVAGADAGQLSGPGGVAADPTTGHLFVTDEGNNRVAEFDAWGQFVKAWGWGVADGQSELQTCGPGATPPTATCRSGLPGAGVGQFDHLRGGITVDLQGNVWVGDLANHRIEKFSPSGDFLLMVGGQVDKGPNNPGNLCTAAFIAGGDTCGGGVVGAGPSEFESTSSQGTALSTGSTGSVVVGDIGRLEEFNLSGSLLNQITLAAPHASDFVKGIVQNSDGSFYLILGPENGNYAKKAIQKVDASGAIVSSIALPWKPTALTLDGAGNIFVAITENNKIFGLDAEIIEFGLAGEPIIPFGEGFAPYREVGGGLRNRPSMASNIVTSAGKSDIYLVELGQQFNTTPANASINAFGPPPDKWLPPQTPPDITSQYATSVVDTSAVVGAEINPFFWTDTTYYVEYGTGKCSEGGCTQTIPVPPGALLSTKAVGSPVPTKGLTLKGLTPDTTYHYRFVTVSTGSAGEPVRGTGGKVGEDGAESAFHTLTPPKAPTGSCPNDIFRTGAAALLPDCRAYEMVSPIDKNNSDITALINIDSVPAMLDQSSLSGEKITYTTSQGFGDAQGTPYLSQYIATRTAGGWQSHGITPPQGLSSLFIGRRIDLEFRAFTADLCRGVLMHATDPPLVPGAVEGYANLYQRTNCGSEGYQAVSTSKPPNVPPSVYVPEPQGFSADGECTVFYATDQLTPDAHPGNSEASQLPGARQLYETCGGELRLVSALPSGKANESGASVGTNNSGSPVAIRTGNSAQAVSSDGSRVYWTANGEMSGRLFLRINAAQEQSPVSAGHCTEEEKACTIAVSQTITGGAAHFWGASADGAKAIFSIEQEGSGFNQNLYEFKLEGEESSLIARKVTDVVGVGGEASRVFFASTEALGGANSEGDSAVSGAENLYFYDEEDQGEPIRFVGTFAGADKRPDSPPFPYTPLARMPYQKTARVSPDGRHLAFTSRAPLTGYDNTDKSSGRPDNEVFVYGSPTGELNCVSCNPTGQRPGGRMVEMEGQVTPQNWSAAFLSPYATELYGSRVISDDGSRVYFNGYEALVPRDTNGKADVYQWEAPGSGDCTESSPLYSPPNGGCLSLISSGESPSDSEFIDADPDGSDVFFATASSLIPQDPGLIDIYDAREGGGYPPPPSPRPACEGEACQGPLAPPNDPTPGSSTFEGAGNVVAKPAKKVGHKKKKTKHKTTRHKQAKHKRRAAR